MKDVKNFKLGATLGESPIWCAATQSLWFVDIRAPAVIRLDPATGNVQRHTMTDFACMVAFAEQGLLVGVGRKIHRFDPTTGIVGEPIVELDRDTPQNRINDTKVAPDGSLWCGTMRDLGAAASGSLYRISPKGSIETLRSNIGVPNSLCYSPDHRWAYFADTREGSILRARLDDSPPLFEHFAAIEIAPGKPDGSTVDCEGFLWNARYGGGCVARIDPTGKLDRLISLPTSQPTSCAFGGADLRTLFVTSANQRMSQAQLDVEPLAGDIFAIACDVAGLLEPRFG